MFFTLDSNFCGIHRPIWGQLSREKCNTAGIHVDDYTQNNCVSFSGICNYRSPRMSTVKEKMPGLSIIMTLLFLSEYQGAR